MIPPPYSHLSGPDMTSYQAAACQMSRCDPNGLAYLFILRGGLYESTQIGATSRSNDRNNVLFLYFK